MQLHPVNLTGCPLAWQRESPTGCIGAFESSNSVQGAKEGQDSTEDAAPLPREKSFIRSRSKDERPMWETWILREAWDKGSLEVEAVHMAPLQSGSPDLLPASSACCEAGSTAWTAHGYLTADSCSLSGPGRLHRQCAEHIAASKPHLEKSLALRAGTHLGPAPSLHHRRRAVSHLQNATLCLPDPSPPLCRTEWLRVNSCWRMPPRLRRWPA